MVSKFARRNAGFPGNCFFVISMALVFIDIIIEFIIIKFILLPGVCRKQMRMSASKRTPSSGGSMWVLKRWRRVCLSEIFGAEHWAYQRSIRLPYRRRTDSFLFRDTVLPILFHGLCLVVRKCETPSSNRWRGYFPAG